MSQYHFDGFAVVKDVVMNRVANNAIAIHRKKLRNHNYLTDHLVRLLDGRRLLSCRFITSGGPYIILNWIRCWGGFVP